MFEDNERDPMWDAHTKIVRKTREVAAEMGVASYSELDSLSRMELIADLEDKLQINIPLDALEGVTEQNVFIEKVYRIYSTNRWGLWIKGEIPKQKERSNKNDEYGGTI